tara:strand:- start:47596 stop:48156 length:561 start_codon:yes stop_codon:yes gene_type:complete
MNPDQFEKEHQEDNEDTYLEDAEESKLKKVYLYTVGGLLILFMISFIFVTFPVGDILAGKIESNKLQGNLLIHEDLQIIFTTEVLNQLQQIYARDQSVEFSACLQGTVDNNDYHITNLYEPKTYLQQFNHVSFESCKDSIILLHSHPHQRCIASSTDINTLSQAQTANPDTLMLVMCEFDRFSVYQ